MSLIPYIFNERPIPLAEREIFDTDILQQFNQIVPKEVFRPLENMFKQMDQLSSLMNNVALKETTKISSDSEKFIANIDVQHFAPDEISVKVGEGFVTVECKHEEMRDEHGFVSRHFVRRYALPKGCLSDLVESKLSSDGVLTVTAPKILAMPSTGERIVPIIQTGPINKQIGSPVISNE